MKGGVQEIKVKTRSIFVEKKFHLARNNLYCIKSLIYSSNIKDIFLMIEMGDK